GLCGASALGPTHVAPRDRWTHPVDPRDPSGGPGTIPMTPKLVPMAETGLPIYKSLPPDHSGTPRDVRDLIRDSEQHSTLRVRETCRHDRDALRSITNSGIWIPMLAPTCSTMISSDEPRCRGFNQSRIQFPLSI
ncbi:hypothetical protein T12_14412, partial [Trichinella patagoniensis]